MSIKKTYRLLGLMALALTLVLLPGPARSAMWVGGELGGNFLGNAELKLNLGGTPLTVRDAKFDNPTVIGGITIGYDFVNAGFLGYAWPDWMKYFGVALDFTYNTFHANSQQVTVLNAQGVPITFFLPGVGGAQLKGYAAALTFLIYGHYGFFPDSEIPVGRVHPYIGVGPAVVFSGIDAGSLGIGNASSTDVALVVEAGIRWIAFKQVSFDTAFRFRWAQPDYKFSSAISTGLKDFESYSFLVRANYHF